MDMPFVPATFSMRKTKCTSGPATPWNPLANGSVLSVCVEGDSAYVAGRFTSIGGSFRTNLAAVSVATAAAASWNPNPDAPVGSIVKTGSLVFASGTFTNIGGALRQSLAGLDATTGLATAWNPSPTPRLPMNGGLPALMPLAIANGQVFVGGNFTSIAGEPRNGAASFDSLSGALTSWDPYFVAGNPQDIAVSGDRAYVVGTFRGVNGVERHALAALDESTGIPADWNPTVDGFVVASAMHDGKLYFGGTFTNVNAAARSHLAAVDMNSGAITSWSPHVGAREKRPGHVINDMLITNSTIDVAGGFTNIAGETRENLAALELSGTLTSWDVSANYGKYSSSVIRIASYDGLLYIGGLFSMVNGETGWR
jgi:hypothetical protein